MVPKIQSAADLHFVADVIRHVAPRRAAPASVFSSTPSLKSKTTTNLRPLQIIGLIESARGLTNLKEICNVGRPLGLTGLAFAAEDFRSALGLTKLPDRREVLHARSSIVTACHAYDIPSVLDMVTVDVSQEDAESILNEESIEGRDLGFTGKQAIHPSQVTVIQRAFAPSDSEIDWAVKICLGDAEAQKEGRGAWNLEGKMIDVPVVKAARAILDKAAMCGMHVDIHSNR